MKVCFENLRSNYVYGYASSNKEFERGSRGILGGCLNLESLQDPFSVIGIDDVIALVAKQVAYLILACELCICFESGVASSIFPVDVFSVVTAVTLC